MKKGGFIKIVLTIFLTVFVFSSLPITVWAANSKTVKIEQSDSWQFIEDKINQTIYDVGVNGTVIVEGSKTGTTNQIKIDFADNNTKLLWKANLVGNCNANQAVITVEGKGTFSVEKGALIEQTNAGGAIWVFSGSNVIINGGTVKSKRDATIYVIGTLEVKGGTVENTGAFAGAIEDWNSGSPSIIPTIKMSGGTVKSNNSFAINTWFPGAKIHISGGTVYAGGSKDSGQAIRAVGKNSRIEVSGGTIESKNDYAIFSEGEESEVIISKGTIKANGSGSGGCGIVNGGKKGVITVSGGTITARLRAILNTGENAKINVSGGTLEAGEAIANGTAGKVVMINISGGTIKGKSLALVNTGPSTTVTISGGVLQVDPTSNNSYAIYATVATNINIKGGMVLAGNGNAVRSEHSSSLLDITGGFVFAYGTAVRSTGTNSTVYTPAAANFKTSGKAAVVAWDKAQMDSDSGEVWMGDYLEYNTELSTVYWYRKDGKNGIYWKNGDNTGFYAIPDAKLVGVVAIIKFNSDGGNSIPKQEVHVGKKPVKPTDPTKDGFDFDGWYTKSDLKTLFDFNKEYIAEDPITVHAKWVAAGETTNNGENEPLDDPLDEEKEPIKNDDLPKNNNWILYLLVGLAALGVGGGGAFALSKKKAKDPELKEDKKAKTQEEPKVEEDLTEAKAEKEDEEAETVSEEQASEFFFCRKCGKQLKVGTLFCGKCGTKVE